MPGGFVDVEKDKSLEACVLRKLKKKTDVVWYPAIGDGVKPKLAFDHAEILATAIERLRSKSEYSSLPAYLLPRAFTLPELQQAYEVVLERAVDKSAFRRRVLSAEVVEETGDQRPTSNRPAALYRLKQPGTLTFFPRTFSPRKD